MLRGRWGNLGNLWIGKANHNFGQIPPIQPAMQTCDQFGLWVFIRETLVLLG